MTRKISTFGVVGHPLAARLDTRDRVGTFDEPVIDRTRDAGVDPICVPHAFSRTASNHLIEDATHVTEEPATQEPV